MVTLYLGRHANTHTRHTHKHTTQEPNGICARNRSTRNYGLNVLETTIRSRIIRPDERYFVFFLPGPVGWTKDKGNWRGVCLCMLLVCGGYKTVISLTSSNPDIFLSVHLIFEMGFSSSVPQTEETKRRLHRYIRLQAYGHKNKPPG